MSDVNRTSSGTAARTRKPRRQRILPFDDHVLDLRREDPDLFQPYDASIIADALAEKLYPADLPNLNVIKELMGSVLGTFRRRFDPGFTSGGTPRPRLQPKLPDKDELASLVLGSFKADTIMRDGRPLGEWTFGEFRQEFAGMSAIIAKFAHLPDDALMGDHLTD